MRIDIVEVIAATRNSKISCDDDDDDGDDESIQLWKLQIFMSFRWRGTKPKNKRRMHSLCTMNMSSFRTVILNLIRCYTWYGWIYSQTILIIACVFFSFFLASNGDGMAREKHLVLSYRCHFCLQRWRLISSDLDRQHKMVQQ